MSSYRFCRTDDIELLVDALNRCWAPYVPDEPPMTAAAFKRSIRDLQVWCSSCMVAFSGSDPIAVLIGAKRASATLVHRIAVHPDHLRHGHARHLLTSLSSKLAILGPPRLVAEVPEANAPVRALFSACGYGEETLLTDHLLNVEGGGWNSEFDLAHRVVIPVTVDDLAANGLLEDAQPHACWERAPETLTARKGEIAGFAVASDEQIEAYVLYEPRDDGTAEIASLHSCIDAGRRHLEALLEHLRRQGVRALVFPKVHPEEADAGVLPALGFRPAGRHRLFAARARAA